jgi:hypothetical protein
LYEYGLKLEEKINNLEKELEKLKTLDLEDFEHVEQEETK